MEDYSYRVSTLSNGITARECAEIYNEIKYGDKMTIKDSDRKKHRCTVVGKFKHFCLLKDELGRPVTLTWVQLVMQRRGNESDE